MHPRGLRQQRKEGLPATIANQGRHPARKTKKLRGSYQEVRADWKREDCVTVRASPERGNLWRWFGLGRRQGRLGK